MLPASDKGFSLVEVLVALAVFSIGVVALLAGTAQRTASMGEIRSRALADMVAENQLVIAMAAGRLDQLPATGGEALMGGERFQWSRRILETQAPGLRRVQIDVSRAEQPDQIIATLTGFRRLQ